jgi:two-component system cell cycle response regulator DivK
MMTAMDGADFKRNHAMTFDPTDAVAMVVDDNRDNLFIVEILLCEDLGVQHYHGCASGPEFFKLLEAQPHLCPDLILLDIQLSYQDGYAVLARLSEFAQLANARVVAVTANVMPHDIAKAQAGGFNGLIGKPIDRKRFPNQIKRILNGEAVWEPY